MLFRSPSLDKAADLARLCGVSLDDLVADEVEVVVAEVSDSDSLFIWEERLIENHRIEKEPGS